MVTCTNPDHDHTTTDDGNGGAHAEPVPMRCQDCLQPAHYDYTIEAYQHDDPDALDCFLIGRLPGASPCTTRRPPGRLRRLAAQVRSGMGWVAPWWGVAVALYLTAAAALAGDWALVGKIAAVTVLPPAGAVLIVWLTRRYYGRKLLDLAMRRAPADHAEAILRACAASGAIGPDLVAEYRRAHGL